MVPRLAVPKQAGIFFCQCFRRHFLSAFVPLKHGHFMAAPITQFTIPMMFFHPPNDFPHSYRCPPSTAIPHLSVLSHPQCTSPKCSEEGPGPAARMVISTRLLHSLGVGVPWGLGQSAPVLLPAPGEAADMLLECGGAKPGRDAVGLVAGGAPPSLPLKPQPWPCSGLEPALGPAGRGVPQGAHQPHNVNDGLVAARAGGSVSSPRLDACSAGASAGVQASCVG